MRSISNHQGEIRICPTCAQPCYDDAESGWTHFIEQWDGIYCDAFPLANGEPIRINWSQESLEGLKDQYPDTYPHPSGSRVRV